MRFNCSIAPNMYGLETSPVLFLETVEAASKPFIFWPWHGNSISSCCLLVYLFVCLFFSKYLHIPHCPSIYLLINSTRQIMKYTWMNGLSPERKRNQNTTRRVAFILWFGMLCFTFFLWWWIYLRFCFCHCKYIVINK